MNDTLEANLPKEEDGKLEETKVTEVTPEIISVDVDTTVATNEETVNADSKLSKDEILEKLTALVETVADSSRNEIDALKQAFYKLRKVEVDDLKQAFLTNGGVEENFVVPEDEAENKLKELLAIYKEKRAAIIAEEERVKAANYALKLQLLEQLKSLSERQEDFNKLYNEFKNIQQRWKEVKLIPQEFANDLWKDYQLYSERFYDIIKINHQFRDYDFKKNLEMKTALCETVEKLQEETDIISAFHQLQKLHQQWREIGPVAKDLRDEIWERFKAGSTVINKRHQAFFDNQKAKEEDNLTAKTAICEEVEAIDFEALKSYKDWDEKSKVIIALQEKWKTIGYAPKKHNNKIFERFRAACDNFYTQKAQFYKRTKENIEKNVELKRVLCEKAEALKDSTDWKNTTDKLIALQKEWKTSGPVTRRQSDVLWKRFITACDTFFENKNKALSSQKTEEQANLAAKKEIIEKIKGLNAIEDAGEAVAELRGLMAQWNAIGFVPFRDKDKIYKLYHEAVDKQFGRLKLDKADRRMQSYRTNLNDMAGGDHGKGKLYSEREKLMRIYERMKVELQTYENNIGFLNVSSKGGGGLIKEMERKIEKLKDEMALTIKKIDAIDENLE